MQSPQLTRDWLQINISLGPSQNGSDRACHVLDTLADTLAERLGAETTEASAWRLWFVRKLPGMRLRVGAKEIDGRREEVSSCLAELQRGSMITHWSYSVYEPEVHQFGGHGAMEAVHDYFHCDTRNWRWWQRQRRDHAASWSDAVVTAANVADLFVQATEGPEEAWDVWCNLALLFEAPTRRLDLASLSLDGLLARCSATEAPGFEAQRRANSMLAARLGQLNRNGSLTCGVRAILPFVALFHWNRFGLDSATMATIVHSMTEAVSPKRGMRGAS